MRQDFNPFILTGYTTPEYFCNRENETKRLIKNIKNQQNTALFALRRLGKTGLIKHVFHRLQAEKKVVCIYIDLYATRNLGDFANLLANAVYQAYPEKKQFAKQFINTFKSLRPVVSIDSLSGVPELSLDLTGNVKIEKTIPQLLTYLEAQNIPIVIAMDEFQQIVHYPEKNVEAILRTKIQELQHCHFIFSGSHQAMMVELFHHVKRPFYNSTTPIYLDKIDASSYHSFIKKMFEKYKYAITDESIDYVLEWTDRFTYHVQAVCHHLFAEGDKKITLEKTQALCLEVLKQQEHIYFQYRNLLTDTQWQLLKAFAKEEIVTQPYTKKFILEYQLGSAAIVKRSLEALVTKEMIYYDASSPTPYYAVNDKFLMRWLQRLPK